MLRLAEGVSTLEYPSQNWIYSAKFRRVKTMPSHCSKYLGAKKEWNGRKRDDEMRRDEKHTLNHKKGKNKAEKRNPDKREAKVWPKFDTRFQPQSGKDESFRIVFSPNLLVSQFSGFPTVHAYVRTYHLIILDS